MLTKLWIYLKLLFEKAIKQRFVTKNLAGKIILRTEKVSTCLEVKNLK
jgi:hypothetical protein